MQYQKKKRRNLHIWNLSNLSVRRQRLNGVFFNNLLYFSYPHRLCKSNTGAGVEWDNTERLFSMNRPHKRTKKYSPSGTQAAVALKRFTPA